jgi:hypothetical protein
MPYSSGSFSAIVSADVLCHEGVDEKAALGEFHRCLGRGGLLLLNLPAYPWLLSRHDRSVHNVRRYGAKEAELLISEAGFSDVRVEHWNGLLFPAILLHRLALGHTRESSDVRPIPGWQNEALFAVTALEARLRSAGLRTPFGSSLRIEARA